MVRLVVPEQQVLLEQRAVQEQLGQPGLSAKPVKLEPLGLLVQQELLARLVLPGPLAL